MKRILSMLLVAVLMTCMVSFAGCESKEKDVALSVYYVKDTANYDSVLEFYNKMNTNITLETTIFDSEEKMAETLATEFSTGNAPDVVLTSDSSALDIRQIIKSGNIADLSKYYSKDKEIKDSKYYLDILNQVNDEGKVYVIPFSFGLNVYGEKTSIEEAGNSVVSDSKDYTAFLNGLKNLQNNLATDYPEDISLHAMTMSKGKSMVVQCIRAFGLGQVKDNKLLISEDDFRAAMDILKNQVEEIQVKDSLFSTPGVGVYSHVSAYTASGNILFMYSMMDTGVHSVLEDTLTMYGIPNVSNDNGYTAIVNNFGFVNSNSKNIDTAYNLLRYIMDYSEGIDNNCTFSFNREVCDKYISKYTKGGQAHMSSENKSYKSRKWTNEEVENLNDIINNVTNIILPNTKIETIMQEAMTDYLLGNGEFDSAYKGMMEQINLYLKE